MEEGENLDQPLSPSLLVEEDQEVVEESEEEEEDSITKGEVEVNRATDNREVMEATAEVSSNLIRSLCT